MGALEERVAYLEGRGEEHAAAIGEVRADIRDLRADMNRRFDHIEQRFDHTDTKFMWLIGFQFTTLIAAIAALLNGYFR
jgi:alpha/beta superfamily hydrolase